ncbi:hypothetical protein VTO73DRAFT_10696 [Trametes versicolor]
MFGQMSRVELAFCREPTDADFRRWVKHSSRVRCIDTRLSSPCKNQSLAPDVYDLLQDYCPVPYLPALNSLSYNDQVFLPGSSVALPPDFHFSRALKAVSLVLSARSNLSCLRACVCGLFPVSSGHRRLEFRSFTNFIGRRVSVEFEDLVGLGELPDLRKLEIETRTEQTNYRRILSRGRQAGFFPALQDLTLHAKEADPRCCIALLGAATPAAAARLFTDLCAALAGLPCPDAVQFITIFLPVGDDVDDEGILVPSPCLEPLLDLHSLRSLRILGGCKVGVDDAMLDKMSLAWPTIHVLLFEWPHRPPASLPTPWGLLMDDEAYQAPAPDAHDLPRATLAGLVPLALRCSCLEDLWVAVDMRRDVPDFARMQHPPVFLLSVDACKVWRLRAAGCIPGDPERVASFLSLVFPKLRHFDWSPPSCDWDLIEKRYQKFVVLRTQEVNWAVRHGKCIKRPK